MHSKSAVFLWKNFPDAEDALYKLSISTHFDNGQAALGVTIENLSARTDSESARLSLAGQSLASLRESPDHRFVVDYCEGDALQNPNRQQMCNGIANTLLQGGDSLFAHAAGLGISSNLN